MKIKTRRTLLLSSFPIFLLITFTLLQPLQSANASLSPQARFTYTPSNPWVNGTITFNASESTPDGGYIVDYAWDFGDGEFDNGMIVFHAYNQSGTYVVTLNVTDSEGSWCTTSKPVVVSSLYGPAANFTYLPPEPFVNGTVTFDASSSTLGWNGTANPPIVEYRWDLGDNTSIIESDSITTHIYQAEGNYTVILNVTDTMGWWNFTSQTLSVHIEAESHDIAIISVTYVPTAIYQNYTPPINITVLVRNNGTIAETFNVTAYYNITTTEWTEIEAQNVTQLDPLANTTLHFTWNASTLPLYGNYTIKIETSAITNDTNPSDNILIDGTITIKIPGDFNGDHRVGYQDFGLLANAYGSRPGYANWNPNCDVNGDNKIGYIDFGLLAKYYGSQA